MKNSSFLDAIGNTPIIFLEKYSQIYNCNLFVKLESSNPAGSIKDRIARRMIEKAVEEGKISDGATIIEPTSGNTGIGLAACAKHFGFRTILTMPESMSLERRKLLKAFGAQIVLTPASKGMSGAVEKAKELLTEIPNSFMPNQFSNPECVFAHYETTAPEIDAFFTAQNIKLDAFITGVGSAGTISGVGKYFKEKYDDIDIIALEPAASAVLSGESANPHGIQGIGAGFIPDNYNSDVVDAIYKIKTEDAYKEAQILMHMEGISCGISTGANIVGLIQYAKKHPNKNILTVVPDSVEKYLSTPLCD